MCKLTIGQIHCQKHWDWQAPELKVEISVHQQVTNEDKLPEIAGQTLEFLTSKYGVQCTLVKVTRELVDESESINEEEDENEDDPNSSSREDGSPEPTIKTKEKHKVRPRVRAWKLWVSAVSSSPLLQAPNYDTVIDDDIQWKLLAQQTFGWRGLNPIRPGPPCTDARLWLQVELVLALG